MSALQSPRAELGFPYDADDGHIGTGTDNSSENFNSLPNVPQELEMNTVSVVPDDAFTVRQAINTFGFGKFQAKLSLFTGLCWMADSMEMTILSILTPALYCIWSISRYQQAMLTMALMVCAFSLICCGLASSFSTSYLWMFFLRGLVGLTVGCVPQSVTLYAEYLPSKQRAKCVVLLDCFWALGACFEVVLALLLMPTQGWTWLLVFSTTPIVAFACICPWLPDSARFFLLQGKTDEAFAILRTVASENNKSMLLGRLVIEDGSNDDKGSVRDLLVPRLRNISLRLWLICKYTLIPLLLIARGVIAGVFQAAYLYTPEVYTSGLRSVGLSTCSVFARLGAVFTPLVSQVLLHSSLAIGISVYGTVAVISAIACVLLPYDHQTEPCKTNPASG
ncbi:unnamed protein product [Nesidiocoris tenuis]|uniref:Major facilitator superfamily (MFS) profile domain-containing protein n=1 Tax=Nesidiocoris tenuis TaxID=355587 RepID=A0A6H5GGD9_9HEMI|nr:unnamed protein product [Nesidiocoris tenuis]